MTTEALQDVLSSVWSTCWGCGPQNEHGLRIKSHWDGAEATCSWQAQPYHSAAPGVLNGGVIASIIDCHGIWTAIAATYQHEQRDYASQPAVWYVTGALNITYLRPTPLGSVLLRARVRELGARSKTEPSGVGRR